MRNSSRKHVSTSFSASTARRIPFVAPSLSVAMSTVALDCHVVEDKYTPVFGIISTQKDYTSALGYDFEIKSKLLERLDVLKASLKENWNGENDCPIEEDAYNNTRAAILATPSVMLKHWRLFPSPNGTLMLSPRDKSIAGISIGNDEFSYAAFVSDDKQISGKEPFDESSFISALKQIHRILGYV